jgi:phage gpG-like protein
VAGRNVVDVIITVDVDNDEAQDRLKAMRDRAKNLKPVLRWAGEKLERAYSANFSTMGSFSAMAMLRGAWPPLDPAYAAWKATRFPGAPTLVMTGWFLKEVSNISSNSASNIDDMEAEFAVVGKIPKFHQYGTENMPARKIIFVPRNFDQDLADQTARFIKFGS